MATPNPPYLSHTLSESEIRRRKREAVLIVAIIAVVAILTFLENRVIHFGTDIPISNTILMFILININLLLLILLLFLVFRNLVKLLYDRKRKVMGARLRTKLVVAFVSLTLLPTTVLFFFSINFITSSIEFWFNVPVEQALGNSLQVGHRVYQRVEESNRFFLERAAYQIKVKKLLDPNNRKALSRYIQVVQREFNFHIVEVYTTDRKRITFAVAPVMENKKIPPLPEEELKKELPLGSVRTVTEMTSSGELIRTFGTVPMDPGKGHPIGFIALSVMIPPDLALDMRSISRGFEEYQQIQLLKNPIQTTYYISLSIVSLLVVFCAIWFGFYLARSISIPIMELGEGTRRVAEGDLSFSIARAADDEIGGLVDSFNKMTRDLRSSREQLELSARMLRRQNVEIEERRQYMEIVLKNVSAGVITLDNKGVVTTMNKSAEKMLALQSSEILQRSYKSLLQGQHLDLASDVMEKLVDTGQNQVEMPLRLTIEGRPRSFLVNFTALRDDSGRHMGIVMVFDDLTELEKAQRMAAWREVARRIAHEVKNPLTPISLSAQRLKRKYADQLRDPVFEECTAMIVDHVDLIRNLVNEFSAFARFPTANPKPCELTPIVDETIALYREGHPDINFQIANASDIPVLNLDRQQIKQALMNLVDNAIAEIKETGTILIEMAHREAQGHVIIEVSDSGGGISDEDKTRLFEPNFSTKKSGMGLGLTIVNSIITDHDGTISVSDNKPNGAKFIIRLPVP